MDITTLTALLAEVKAKGGSTAIEAAITSEMQKLQGEAKTLLASLEQHIAAEGKEIWAKIKSIL